MKWIMRLFKRKRSPEEVLLSLMSAGWFLSMHGDHNDKAMAMHVYANLERTMKNGRVRQVEAMLQQMMKLRLKQLEGARSGHPS
jgi:hypothetical protein